MDKENWRADREACCVKLYDSLIDRGLPVIVTTRVAETQFHQPQSDGSTSEVTHICGLREA